MKNKPLKFILLTIIILQSIFLFYISISKPFDLDEIEHIHSAWYIKEGFNPYSDFFQHHHPLLWYMLAPIIMMSGEKLITLHLIRYIFLLISLSNTFLIYKIAKIIFNKTIGLLSSIFLLSSLLFINKSVEIRPDNVMLFFELLSLYSLLKFFKNKRPYNEQGVTTLWSNISKAQKIRLHKTSKVSGTTFPKNKLKKKINNVIYLKNKVRKLLKFLGLNHPLLLSAISLSLSFLFLQKAIYFILIILGILFISVMLKKLSLKQFLLYLSTLSFPILIFLLFITTFTSLKEYWLLNWKLNMHYHDNFALSTYLIPNFKPNLFFWLFSTLGFLFLFFKKGGKPPLPPSRNKAFLEKVFIIVFLGSVFSLFLVRAPYEQYFLPLVYFASILAGYGLIKSCKLINQVVRNLSSRNFGNPKYLGSRIWGSTYHRLSVVNTESVWTLDWIPAFAGMTKKTHVKMTIIIVTFIVINFFYSNYFVLNRITNNGNEEFRKKQLNMYQYVLDNTNQEDIVHDGGNEFNLFRKDMHYFWFTFHTGGLFTYNEVTNNRLGDYNPCQEIQDKKPKIASGTGYDYQTCDAKEMYEFSGYNNLVKRK